MVGDCFCHNSTASAVPDTAAGRLLARTFSFWRPPPSRPQTVTKFQTPSNFEARIGPGYTRVGGREGASMEVPNLWIRVLIRFHSSSPPSVEVSRETKEASAETDDKGNRRRRDRLPHCGIFFFKATLVGLFRLRLETRGGLTRFFLRRRVSNVPVGISRRGEIWRLRLQFNVNVHRLPDSSEGRRMCHKSTYTMPNTPLPPIV